MMLGVTADQIAGRSHRSSTPKIRDCSTGPACDLIEGGDAQEGGRFFASLLHLDLRNLFFCGSEADAELLDITEPSLAFCFSDPAAEVVSDLFESGLFGGANDEDRTPDT